MLNYSCMICGRTFDESNSVICSEACEKILQERIGKENCLLASQVFKKINTYKENCSECFLQVISIKDNQKEMKCKLLTKGSECQKCKGPFDKFYEHITIEFDNQGYFFLETSTFIDMLSFGQIFPATPEESMMQIL